MVDLGDNICLSVHVELIPIHLKLVASKLWKEHLVSNPDLHGNMVSTLGVSETWTYSHDGGLHPLGLGLLWNQDTTLGSSLRGQALN